MKMEDAKARQTGMGGECSRAEKTSESEGRDGKSKFDH